MSATATINSPLFIIPRAFSRANVLRRLLSMSPEKSRRNGINPHCRFSRCRMDLVSVKAKIGQSGLDLDKSEAMNPRLVYTKIASAPSLSAAILKQTRTKRITYCYKIFTTSLFRTHVAGDYPSYSERTQAVHVPI